MNVPDVGYARAGGVAIAYQVVGAGSRTLVYAQARTNLYTLWLSPTARPFLDRLSQEVRLIVINPRGTGLSDRPRNTTLEARMDDVNAVLDAIEISAPRCTALRRVATSARSTRRRIPIAASAWRSSRRMRARCAPLRIRMAATKRSGADIFGTCATAGETEISSRSSHAP